MTPTPVLPSLPDLTPEIECAALSAWNLSEYGASAEDTVHPMFLTAFKAGFQDARRAIESISRAPAEPAYFGSGTEAFPAHVIAKWPETNRARFNVPLYAHSTESAGPAPAEIEADARRYRWLREQHTYDGEGDCCSMTRWYVQAGREPVPCDPGALDAEIDAAIKLGESHEG